MVIIYRIKHKPSGLYYCPSRLIKCKFGEFVKSNLSIKGKTYHNKPSLKHIGDKIYTHLLKNDSDRTRLGNKVINCTIDDFEIEVMKMN